MKEIVVKTQAAFDAIPQDFDGTVRVVGEATIVVTPRKSVRVALFDNSFAELWGNSSAELHDNSRAVLWNNSSAELWGNSFAELWDYSVATLYDDSSAELWGNSSALLNNKSSVALWSNSCAELLDNSVATLNNNSSACLYNNSFAVLRDNSNAWLWSNSCALLYDNSCAELWGNSQVTDRTKTHEIKINGNARIVYDPRNIDEYLSFSGLLSDGETCLLYKAVHKKDGGVYKSDHDNCFFYHLGEVVTASGLTTDTSVDCGEGIHLSYPAWAVNYGKDWDDLAILELQVKKSEIIVPENECGKVRAKSAKVIREVPLEDCGILGVMIAKRNKKENEK